MSRSARPLLLLSNARLRQGRRLRGAGFSLIEVLVVIGLLLLIILVGLPAFTGVLASMRVRAVAESLLSGVQMARTEAVRRNQPASFRLDAEEGGGWSVLLVADGSTLQAKPASEGGSVNVQGDLDSSLTFNNLGQRTAPAGGVLTFSFTNPGVGDCQPVGNIRCLSVTVEPGGQARLCDPRRTAPDPQAC
jgi:type IV fimbrial biogenesis protein FimT